MTTSALPRHETPTQHFPDLERCDRCGAAGKVLVVLLSGLDLVLCQHHFRDAEDELITQVADWNPIP